MLILLKPVSRSTLNQLYIWSEIETIWKGSLHRK